MNETYSYEYIYIIYSFDVVTKNFAVMMTTFWPQPTMPSGRLNGGRQ